MAQYLAMDPITDMNMEPLIWWYSEGKQLFPNLFLAAEKWAIGEGSGSSAKCLGTGFPSFIN